MSGIFNDFQKVWDKIEKVIDWGSINAYEKKHNIKKYTTRDGVIGLFLYNIDELKKSAMSTSVSAYISKSIVSGGRFTCDATNGSLLLEYRIGDSVRI